MQDKKTEKELLLGTSCLCKQITFYPYIILHNGDVVARFTLTFYPNDENAYLGFFECIDSKEVSNFLFSCVEKEAKKFNKVKVIGPVDASFWIRYRLKINHFDKKPYTCEPYNRDYFRIFQENGYQITDHYTSNIYSTLNQNYTNKKYEERLKIFQEKGYSIKSVKEENFEKCLKEIYSLVSILYSDFPIYKNISYDDFYILFKDMKKILDFNMVKMAYFNEKAVGFFISIPNYSNLIYTKKILKILKIKKHPKEYVMLYMGVLPEHKGLGKAMAATIINELKILKVSSIGALAHDGKVTQSYAEDVMTDRYEYVLLERKL